MEIYHVPNRSIRNGWAEYRDVILKSYLSLSAENRSGWNHLVRPVIYRSLVVDLLPQSPDERAGSPKGPCFVLFRQHSVQQRHEPVLKFAVVLVRYDEISDTIHAFSSQIGTIQPKVGQIGVTETFDEILLDPACGGDNGSNMLVFHEMQDDFTKARRNKIGRIAQEYVATRPSTNFGIEILIWLTVCDRIVCESPSALLKSC